MSPLRQTCDEYLALRRALGFKLKRHGRLLPNLVAHLDAAGETTVTTRLALEWATQPAVALELEAERSPQGEILIARLTQRAHAAPPGHGRASSRRRSRSTLA